MAFCSSTRFCSSTSWNGVSSTFSSCPSSNSSSGYSRLMITFCTYVIRKSRVSSLRSDGIATLSTTSSV